MALQIRRGTDTQRQALSGPSTPIIGELLYSTDNKKLYIGDGTTTGGTSIGYFGSVAVSGQSTIRSTGTNEALTIVAGANISLVTDANTGTLTIAAAPQELNNGSLRLFQNNISSINSNENINIAPAGTGQVNITSSLIVAGGVATSLIRTTESKITLGLEAGQTSQGNFTVAIGYGAGKTSQGQNSVAIGVDSGKFTQHDDAVSIGYAAGKWNQSVEGVAVGPFAGYIAQGEKAIAIGSGAGGGGNDIGFSTGGQGIGSIAVGASSGYSSQGEYAVAIGVNAGNIQGVNAVAIGVNAGAEQQGASSVAIGSYAGQTSQPARTTIINASGTPVNGVAAQTDSFYVAPIRSATGTSGVLQYNSTTKEVSYNNTISVTSVTANTFSTSGLTLSQNNITTATSNSNLVFDTSGTGRIELRSPTEGSRLELYTDFVGSGLFIANNSPTNAGFVLVNSHDTASLSPTYVAAPLGSSQTGSPASYARSRGNALFPSAVLNNDEIMAFDFLGQTDPVNQLRSAAKLKVIADSAPSAGNLAGRFELSTTNSAGAQAVRLSVSSTAVTSTVPVKLAVYADSTARDADVTSPTAGMMIFLTTGTKFQGYTGSAWVDLN